MPIVYRIDLFATTWYRDISQKYLLSLLVKRKNYAMTFVLILWRQIKRNNCGIRAHGQIGREMNFHSTIHRCQRYG